MFCSQCGTKLPDNAAFCSECGAGTKQELSQKPQAAPAPEKKPCQVTEKAKQILAKLPKPQAALAYLRSNLILVTTVVSILLIVCGIISTLNTAFYDVPTVSFVLTINDEKEDFVDEMRDSLKKDITSLKWKYELQEEYLSKREKQDVKKLIQAIEDLRDVFSVRNFRTFVNAAEKVDETMYDGDLSEDAAEMRTILAVLQAAVWGFFLLPVLFTVLGCWKKRTALTVVGIVLTAVSQLLLCNILFVLLTLAVGVFRAVLCSKAQAAAKAA